MGCIQSTANDPGKPEGGKQQEQEQQQQQQAGNQDDELPYGYCRLVLDAEGFTGAYHPADEQQRKKHLDSLSILDTEPEKRFDEITRLCCLIFKVPIALVSLVDSERQWFKSVQGLQCNQTDRKSSFCAWTLLPANPEALVVCNALDDARFKNNPLVTGPPHIRFYAGCPLVCSNGQRLGSLCIIDSEPRDFDAMSCSILANMAEMVTREIERDKVVLATNSKEHQMLFRALDSAKEAMMLLSPTSESWTVLYCNATCQSVLGLHDLPAQSTEFWEIFDPVDDGLRGDSATISSTTSSVPNIALQYTRAIEAHKNFEMELAFHQSSPSGVLHSAAATSGSASGAAGLSGSASGGNLGAPRLQQCLVQFRCATNTIEDQGIVQIGIPNFLGSDYVGPVLYLAIVRDCRPLVLASQGLKYVPTFSLAPDLQPFDDVSLGPLVGKGAFGRVYRGTWKQKLVAVKIIEYREQETGRNLEGLLSENLSHPNVVHTYIHMSRRSQVCHGNQSAMDMPDESEEGGLELMETWLVLEFCNHGCISDGVAKGLFRTPNLDLNFPVVLATAIEVARALAYLHSRGILHIDLTGNNVLLTKDATDPRGWVAKVSDFGLSRYVAGDESVTTRTHGTVTHMPPELLLEGRMSKAVDVYSFGVICWEMLMGHRPFAGMSQSQVLHATSSGKRLEVPAHVAVLARFRALVNECLARHADKRPGFPEIVERLEAMQPTKT